MSWKGRFHMKIHQNNSGRFFSPVVRSLTFIALILIAILFCQASPAWAVDLGFNRAALEPDTFFIIGLGFGMAALSFFKEPLC